MHHKSRITGILVAVAMLVAMPSSWVSASPQAACSLLTLAEVHGLIGPNVVVFQPSSAGPTIRGDHTVSNCVYMPPGSPKDWKGAESGFFTLMWGPPATLNSGLSSYAQRHWIARIKGGVLATAVVSKGTQLDRTASSKLLDAVLKKL
jgi:hypothetical protein